MRLLGKYTFERLRDALQGVFEFYKLNTDTDQYIIELWQLRIYIIAHKSVELSVNSGPNEGYISLGKINLS